MNKKEVFTLFLLTLLNCGNYINISNLFKKPREKRDIAFILQDIDPTLAFPTYKDSLEVEFKKRIYPDNQPKPKSFTEINEQHLTKKFGKETLQLVKDMRELGYDIIPYLEDSRFSFYNDIPKLRYKYNKKSSITKKRYWQIVNNAAKRYIDKGTKFFLKNEKLLWEIVLEEGADPHYITAIYGIETNLGKNKGTRRAFCSWVSIYRDFPKDRYGRLNAPSQLKELIDFAEESDKDLLEIMGSFMGCIGDCQTLPNNRKRFGVDYDKDGVINPFNFEDNLAFIANYLDNCGFDWNKSRAVYAYNHQRLYVDIVTTIAKKIKTNVGEEKKKFKELVLNTFKNQEAKQDITKLF